MFFMVTPVKYENYFNMSLFSLVLLFLQNFNAAQNCWKRLRVYTDSSNRGRSLTVIVFHVAQALSHVYQAMNPFHI